MQAHPILFLVHSKKKKQSHTHPQNKTQLLTLPPASFGGFSSISFDNSSISLIKRSATPGWVCKTVTAMWMLKKNKKTRRQRKENIKPYITLSDEILQLVHNIMKIKASHSYDKRKHSLMENSPGRILQGIQIPASLAHSIGELIDVIVIGPQGNNWYFWLAIYKDSFDLATPWCG